MFWVLAIESFLLFKFLLFLGRWVFGFFFGGEGFLDGIWGYIFHLFFGVVFFVCLAAILLFVFLKIYY